MLTNDEFAARLTAIKTAKRMTWVEIANRTDTSTTTLFKYRSATNQPTAYMVAALADALDVSADVLLCRVPFEGDVDANA